MCDNYWNDMKSGLIEMKPIFFSLPNCQGIPQYFPNNQFFKGQIQSFILPENFQLYLKNNDIFSIYDYHDQSVIVKDTLLEIIEWSNGKKDSIYNLSDLWKVTEIQQWMDDKNQTQIIPYSSSITKYWEILYWSCKMDHKPPKMFFSWNKDSCPTIMNIIEDGYKRLEQQPLPSNKEEGEEENQNHHQYQPQTNKTFWIIFIFSIIFLLIIILFILYFYFKKRKSKKNKKQKKIISY